MLTIQTYLFSTEHSSKSHFLIEEKGWALRFTDLANAGGKSSPGELLFPLSNEENKVLRLSFDTKKVKANGYPSLASPKEELQLPIVGDEHLIFVAKGIFTCYERSTERKFILESNQCLRITRPNKKKEYLNLKVMGQEERNSLVWLVIHRLSDNE